MEHEFRGTNFSDTLYIIQHTHPVGNLVHKHSLTIKFLTELPVNPSEGEPLNNNSRQEIFSSQSSSKDRRFLWNVFGIKNSWSKCMEELRLSQLYLKAIHLIYKSVLKRNQCYSF